MAQQLILFAGALTVADLLLANTSAGRFFSARFVTARRLPKHSKRVDADH
jgi:hypothetical protein